MQRRDFLAGTAGAGLSAAIARPSIAQGTASRVLKFVPQSDLTVVDPIVTTAYVTRNHGYLIWDTLYGLDEDYKPQPQMVEGHAVEDDGKRWTLKLREGLRFHDGEPVRARDAVASIRRWGARDPLGQVLLARTDALEAPDDRTIVFRLKQSFPLLPDALGKPSSPVCFIMPERLARTEATTAVRELIGSGPYRWKADERVPGSRVVYERHPEYAPRADGKVSWTAGPKRVNFDRVEWHVIQDGGTASAALQNGEVDWWEQPGSDLFPLLRRNRNVVLELYDPTGFMAVGRFNHLYPPFDNPAVRRALLGAVNQADFMTAVTGTDRSLWRENVGVFPPETPMASDAGLEVLKGPRDMEKVRRDLAAAGYKGEKVLLMAPADFPTLFALAQVGADMMTKAGINVDLVTTDWGTLVQRRARREPPDKGGWNMFFTFWSGLDMFNPAVSQALRGNGQAGWFGWATAPKLEELRDAWLDAPDLAAQQRIAAEEQQQAMVDVPFLPLGQYFPAWAYRRDASGVLKGLPLFWNVQRA